MSLILDGTAGVTFPSGSGTQAAQSKVLQVVQATYGTGVTNSTTTPATTNLTATITPLFSTSKILIIATTQGIQKYTGNAAAGVNLYLYKNGSNLVNYALYVGYNNVSGYNCVGGNTINYLDSPATTSATTYAVYFAATVAGIAASVNSDADLSTITLMEIAQ